MCACEIFSIAYVYQVTCYNSYDLKYCVLVITAKVVIDSLFSLFNLCTEPASNDISTSHTKTDTVSKWEHTVSTEDCGS